MEYQLKFEKYDGPLDVLLNLIDEKKLEITNIALAEVTDKFIETIKASQIPPEQVVDFLLIASQLLAMKSRALLPYLVEPTEEEQQDERELEQRLMKLKLFRLLGESMATILQKKKYSQAREFGISLDVQFLPGDIDSNSLQQSFREFIFQFPDDLFLEEQEVGPVINIEEKFELIKKNLQKAKDFSFNTLVGDADVTHRIVTFLAMLELIKQRIVEVDQSDLFEDLNIKSLNKEYDL